MHIVIDIPEDDYEYLKNHNKHGLYSSILNGTILPKGHGRLGDLDKIYVKLNEAQIEGTEEYKGLGEAKQIVCDAKSIIEADKAESEEL